MVKCGYCKDCKWWEERDHERQTKREGFCLRMQEADGKFKIEFPFSQEEYPDIDFISPPDFGCVQFEKKQHDYNLPGPTA